MEYVDFLTMFITIISPILAVASTIFAVWALVSGNKQGRILNDQTDKMSESLGRSDKMILHLSKQAEEMEKIIDNLETRHIEPFPNNFNFIDNLLSYCEQKETDFGRKRIEIFTDVAGYGILSKNGHWQQFNEKITKIIKECKVEIFWCFYTGNLRNKHIEQQFNELKNNLQERQKYIKQCLSDAPHLCIPPKYPCPDKDECFVRHIHDAFEKEDVTYDEILQLADTLQNMEENNIELLAKQPGTKLTIKKLKEENEILPYFGWFVYEEKETFKPVQAMISFPYYAERREEGLITKHKGIIEAFRSKLPPYEKVMLEVRPDRYY
jgi:hypothetical protein